MDDILRETDATVPTTGVKDPFAILTKVRLE